MANSSGTASSARGSHNEHPSADRVERGAHLLQAGTHLLDVGSGLCGELLDVIEQCVCRLEHAAMPVLSLLVGENVEAGSLEVGTVDRRPAEDVPPADGDSPRR